MLKIWGQSHSWMLSVLRLGDSLSSEEMKKTWGRKDVLLSWVLLFFNVCFQLLKMEKGGCSICWFTLWMFATGVSGPSKAICSGILFNSLTVWQGLEYLNHFPLPPKMHWQGAGAPTPLQPEMQSSELQLNQPHHNVHLSPLILDSSKFHMHLLQSLAPLPLLSR